MPIANPRNAMGMISCVGFVASGTLKRMNSEIAKTHTQTGQARVIEQQTEDESMAPPSLTQGGCEVWIITAKLSEWGR